MKIQIIIPAQKTLTDDIEIESEIVIVGEVTGFWGYAVSGVDDPRCTWCLNPNGLTFSTEPDDFISLCLEGRIDDKDFRLIAEHECTDSANRQIIQSVVFEVDSVMEVRDFPSITS